VSSEQKRAARPLPPLSLIEIECEPISLVSARGGVRSSCSGFPRLWGKQTNQPFLFEVAVGGKRFGFATFAHQDETDGVAQ
jgi:hypothetical protein